MFARFVKPSELYMYSGMCENGLGYWSNLQSVSLESGVDVTRTIRVKGVWNRLSAPQRFNGRPDIFAVGHLRGNNLQARADFRLRENWKAHILLERMAPGDFYSHRAGAYFLRFETSIRFNMIVRAKELVGKL
jgi:hypothetical protein